jgi:hypothetical protein
MRFLTTINYFLKRYAKGMFLLFAINSIVLITTFIIQSCEKNDYYPNGNNENNVFKSSIIESLDAISNITTERTKDNELSKTNLTQIELYTEEGVSISDYPNFDNSLTFGDLVNIANTDIKVKHPDGSETDNISDDQQLIDIYQVSELEIQQMLQPTVLSAKNYLYSKGLTDLDIDYLLSADEEGPAMSESDLIPVVLELIAAEQNQNVSTNFDYSKLFGGSLYASQIGSCAGDALGISAIAAVLSQGMETQAAKMLLKKAIRKVAARSLGWVGAAIFAYEFGDCMGWW